MSEYHTEFVDTAIFSEASKAIGLNIGDCPACRTKDSSYFFHETGDESHALSRTKDAALKQVGMEVLVLECATCGYLMLFSRDRFMHHARIAQRKNEMEDKSE